MVFFEVQKEKTQFIFLKIREAFVYTVISIVCDPSTYQYKNKIENISMMATASAKMPNGLSG